MNPQRDIKTFKIILSIIVMALAFYPVFELTRYIVQYNIIKGVSQVMENTYAELAFIWIFYLLIPVAINWMLSYIEKAMRKKYLDRYLESMEKKSEIELGRGAGEIKHGD